jgi:mRNA interferase RelE/StbE
MDSYRIEWKSSARSELERLDRHVVGRIVAAVESLSSNPCPSGFRKLRGTERTYRIRVGDYRVLYEVFQMTLVVHVVRVRHRKDAYRK